MVKHQSQDLHHLPIATGAAQEVVLQSLESIGQFQERGRRCAERLAFSGSPPDNGASHTRSARARMRPVDDARVLADNMAFRHDHKLVGIDPQADRSVGKRRRHAVAVALQMDQSSR
jgi:hypothetical protein